MRAIGEILQARAKELGFTDAEVARRVGLSQNRYSNYMTGAREPDLRTFARICAALGISPNDVLGTEGSAKPSRTARLSRQRIDALLETMNEKELALAGRLLAALVAPNVNATAASLPSDESFPAKAGDTSGKRRTR